MNLRSMFQCHGERLQSTNPPNYRLLIYYFESLIIKKKTEVHPRIQDAERTGGLKACAELLSVSASGDAGPSSRWGHLDGQHRME